MKYLILFIFFCSICYIHFRGKVRYKLLRQLSDHSTFVAPLNCFMYAFSKIAKTPFLPAETFPELQHLKDNWQEIRKEAEYLHSLTEIKSSDRFNDAGFNSFFKTGWKRFYLKWYDDAHPSARELCPITTDLINKIPGIKAAMFASLPDGSRLPKHRDPYAGSIRYHLGLKTPNSDLCFIDVDGTRYSWRDGEEILFDETYIHFAENKSGEDRLILFCDIERPMTSRWAQQVNYFFGRYLVAAAAAPNNSNDKTGGINKIFKYVYQIRIVGKKLKACNKTAYYLIKWILFTAIAITIWMHI